MAARKKKRNIIRAVAAALMVLAAWTVWSNTALEMHTYTVTSDRLPDAFDGYRIAHVSDLHNAEMGEGNEKLLTMLREAKPDMIAITGDFIDSQNTNVEIALNFAAEAVKIAPCYYVTGNHEAWGSEYEELKTGLLEEGVNVLEDEKLSLGKDDDTIVLIGVHDPSYQTDYLFGDNETVMQSKLAELMSEEGYTILLSHRPELFDIYAKSGVDLVLSGHAHGGQFRLPFIGGLVAPDQGVFPKYDAGLYIEESTHMIVSRGIGNSILPLRFNNRPEVILIELQK